MIKIIKQILYVLNKKQKWYLFVVAWLTFFAGIFELLSVSAVLPFVESLVEPDKILDEWYMKAIYDFFGLKSIQQFVIVMLIGLILLFIVKNIYVIMVYKIQYRFTYNNKCKTTVELMNAYMKKPYLFFVGYDTSALMRDVRNDPASFYTAVLQIMHLFTEGIVCFLLFIYLFYKDKSITIAVVFAVGCFGFLFVRVVRRKVKEYGDESREINRRIDELILQAFGGIKEIKVMNKEPFFENKYKQENIDLAVNNNKYVTFELLPKNMMECMTMTALLAVVGIKVYRGVDMAYFIPTISVFAMAAFRIMPSASRVVNSLNTLTYYKAAVDAVYHTFKRLRDADEVEVVEEGTSAKVEGNIELRNVYFKYPEGNKYILNDSNLLIKKNTSVAFIGPSGEGKTTLIDTILGILPIESGNILIGGSDLKDNVRGWQKNIGYIPQNIYLTNSTIRENIAFGIKPEDIDEEAVNRAVKNAQLEHLINELPDGLDTEIGERGIRLSGGQRQRIGIARALYTNPAVLVLDEATSALDNETEAAIMDAINALQGNKTILIIAHRLSTVRQCDEIYEVKDGKVLVCNKEELYGDEA